MKLITPESPDWHVLFEEAAPVVDYDHQVKPRLSDMHAIFMSKRALGLAAPQIGVSLQFFIYRTALREVFRIVVNPTITWRSRDIRTQDEGCLSFPGIYVVARTAVARPESVRVEYTMATGEKTKRLLGGTEARIFQHEFDHLCGVTIFPNFNHTPLPRPPYPQPPHEIRTRAAL